MTLAGAAPSTPGVPPLMEDDCTTSPHRFRVARIPEQRTSSVASEVKTITEARPSGGDLPDSPQCGLSSEQRALLGSGGSHPKWLKPPAENKAEVRTRGERCLLAPVPTPTADGAGVEVQRATFLESRSPLTALTPHPCPPGEPLCGPAE